MGYIMGHALDGSMVALDTEMIAVVKGVPTKQLIGEEKWNAQSAAWQKQNQVATVVATRGTPTQAETWFGSPFVLVAAAINKSTSTSYSEAFILIETLQEYDTAEFDALLTGDKEYIKEHELRQLNAGA